MTQWLKTLTVSALLTLGSLTPAFSGEGYNKNVEDNQYCLTLLGYPVGKIDGIAGRQSITAFTNHMVETFGPNWVTVPEETRHAYMSLHCRLTEHHLLTETQPTPKPPSQWPSIQYK